MTKFLIGTMFGSVATVAVLTYLALRKAEAIQPAPTFPFWMTGSGTGVNWTSTTS